MNIKTGFTLIELLVVIAIVGILAGIAYPSFQSHMLKARRGEAQSELIKAQMQQTSFHILNPSYTSDKNTLGLIDNDYYTFTVTSAGVSTYAMKAVAKGQQTNDSGCLTLTIDHDSTQSPANCW